MIDNNTIFKKCLEFPSERKSVKLFEPIIAELHSSVNFSDELYYNILIAGTEAVNNAIIHGNKCLKCKIVKLCVMSDGDSIGIEVEDEGEGFEFKEVADPRNPDNLMKVNGRGVFLIKQLSDTTSFVKTEAGMMVKMSFKI